MNSLWITLTIWSPQNHVIASKSLPDGSHECVSPFIIVHVVSHSKILVLGFFQTCLNGYYQVSKVWMSLTVGSTCFHLSWTYPIIRQILHSFGIISTGERDKYSSFLTALFIHLIIDIFNYLDFLLCNHNVRNMTIDTWNNRLKHRVNCHTEFCCQCIVSSLSCTGMPAFSGVKIQSVYGNSVLF